MGSWARGRGSASSIESALPSRKLVARCAYFTGFDTASPAQVRCAKVRPSLDQPEGCLTGTDTFRVEGVRRLEGLLARRSLRLTEARRAIAEAVLERRGHFAIEELI